MRSTVISLVLVLLLSVNCLSHTQATCKHADWIVPAWEIAKRESRRSLPERYRPFIDRLTPPETRWQCGPVTKMMTDGTTASYAGVTTVKFDGRTYTILIEIGVLGDDGEDFSSLVHEDQHAIASMLPLTQLEAVANQIYVDLVWAWGSK